MTGTERDPAVVPDPYLTEQGLPGGGSSPVWAPTGERREPTASNWATFAGVVLLIAGVGHVLIGLVVFDASNFVAGESDPPLRIGYSAWGWIQLVLGAVLIAAGSALLAGKAWGRVVAIVFAAVSAIGALGFLPTAPVWGAILIALNVVIVYALTVHPAESSG
jgi:hypothetical protein